MNESRIIKGDGIAYFTSPGGVILYSEERGAVEGDLRLVNGRLHKVCSVERRFLRKPLVHWMPVWRSELNATLDY